MLLLPANKLSFHFSESLCPNSPAIFSDTARPWIRTYRPFSQRGSRARRRCCGVCTPASSRRQRSLCSAAAACTARRSPPAKPPLSVFVTTNNENFSDFVLVVWEAGVCMFMVFGEVGVNISILHKDGGSCSPFSIGGKCSPNFDQKGGGDVPSTMCLHCFLFAKQRCS